MKSLLRRAALLGVVVCSLTFWSCGASGPGAPTTPTNVSAAIAPAPTAAASSGGPVTWSCFTAKGTLFSSECGVRSRLTPQATQGRASIPFAPGGLTQSVSSNTVTLTWVAATTSGSDPVTSYLVEAGTASGLSDITDNFDTGSAQPTLTVTSVGAGTYYVRVRARNSSGLSLPSNEVVVIVLPPACSGTPGAPSRLIATVTGSTVALSWTAPTSGCAPTTYQIEAGSAPGASNLARVSTGSSNTSFTAANVTAGSYYVRVRAGTTTTGAASNEIVVTVPGA